MAGLFDCVTHAPHELVELGLERVELILFSSQLLLGLDLCLLTLLLRVHCDFEFGFAVVDPVL